MKRSELLADIQKVNKIFKPPKLTRNADFIEFEAYSWSQPEGMIEYWHFRITPNEFLIYKHLELFDHMGLYWAM